MKKICLSWIGTHDLNSIAHDPKFVDGGGYGVIYRQKHMYSPFIAYLPPRSLNNLDYKDIYVHIAKIPERFSKKFILREPDGDYLETLATLYAQASASIPVIKEKVFNSSLLYS